VDIHVNADGFSGAPVEMLSRAVALTLESGAVTEGEVSLTLMDDTGIRSLNQEYLGHDRVTDVIAFTLSERLSGGDEEPLLGDVYIGFMQAERQATQLGIPVRDELARLAIHGTLHVLGHDHPEGDDRFQSPMWALQEALLTRLLDSDT
jgi:probable rRNA maturation factor